MPPVLPYLYGALTMACAAIALFFVRYSRFARDELFVWFTLAFAVFGLQWALLAFGVATEATHYLYLLRLVGFLLIVAAILRKNRRGT